MRMFYGVFVLPWIILVNVWVALDPTNSFSTLNWILVGALGMMYIDSLFELFNS